jgi:hypothetical protein
MDKKIKEQILAIRETGETNMFDVPVVRKIAKRKGYMELYNYLSDHSGEYARFILTGEE